MKVFVGYGYNDADKWIRDQVIPLLEALGCKVLTGEEMAGENLAVGVLNRIDECDALIGFMTKRGQPDANGVFTTHHWVIAEVAAAIAKEKIAFEIREKGVDPQKGIAGDRQRYDFEDHASVLLEVTKFIMKEKTKLSYKAFMLMPFEFAQSIKDHIKFATCTYKFLHNAKEYEEEKTKIIPTPGGYMIYVKQIPDENCTVQVTVASPGGTWTSPYVSVGLININLSKEN